MIVKIDGCETCPACKTQRDGHGWCRAIPGSKAVGRLSELTDIPKWCPFAKLEVDGIIVESL